MTGAGDQSSPWAHGGDSFAPATPQLLPRCHPPNPLHGSLPIPCDGPVHVPPWPTSPFFDDPFYLGPQTSVQPLDDLSEIAGEGHQVLQTADWGNLYQSELGAIISSSGSAASALFNGQQTSPCFGNPSLPSNEDIGGGILTSGLIDSPLPSSGTGGPTDFYSMDQHELPCYSSVVPFSGRLVVSSNGPTALPSATATFCPPPSQELQYYSTREPQPMINSSSSISSTGESAPPVAVGPQQADPSALIWTPDEQRLLVELCKRYGHIDDPIIRVAKLARPFPGKNMRDVALRMRWMEQEKRSQKTKAACSSRSRGTKVPVRSRDLSSQLSSHPGIPY